MEGVNCVLLLRPWVVNLRRRSVSKGSITDLLFYLNALWIRNILVNLARRKVFEEPYPFFHCIIIEKKKFKSINCQLLTHTRTKRSSPYKFFFSVAQRKYAFTQSLWPTPSVDPRNFSHAWGSIPAEGCSLFRHREGRQQARHIANRWQSDSPRACRSLTHSQSQGRWGGP